MELVLSPGSLGDNDGAPFRNEDVQEWSHVDRLTGMLERARIETGRWRTNEQGTARSYGKMIDSRERNSSDGSLVQKARRQVEVFQSQATSGKSVQVVRASQWSSSRSTESTFHIHPPNEHCVDNIDNIVSRKLDYWKLNGRNSMLDELSYLCRKIHSEVVNLNDLNGNTSLDEPQQPIEAKKQRGAEPLAPAAGDTRSAASEDAANSAEAGPADSENRATSPTIARDCAARRSPQVSNEPDPSDDRRINCVRSDKFANFAERMHNSSAFKPYDRQYNSLSDIVNPVKPKLCMSNGFHNNDEHQTGASSDVQTNGISTVLVNGTIRSMKDDAPTEEGRNSETGRSQAAKKPVNKTVVHLSSDPSTAVTRLGESEAAQRINVTAIELKEHQSSTVSAVSVDGSDESSVRPVKKVGFSKTEIHFAPDSGKVNIVETDGKPPPTNKFRRRRRNSLGLSSSNPRNLGVNNNNNLPLVHFGDTSYEKFIFGGGKNPETVKETCVVNPKVEDVPHEECGGDKWEKQPKAVVSTDDDNRLEEHGKAHANTVHEKTTDPKHRGHTTTINFVTNAATREPRKVVQGTNAGIQLRFDKALTEQSSRSILDLDKNPLVTCTTKMTVHIPLIMPQISRPLKQNPFSTLKSVQLILSLKHSDNFDTKIIKNYVSDHNKVITDLFSSLCEPNALTLHRTVTNVNDRSSLDKQIVNTSNKFNENVYDSVEEIAIPVEKEDGQDWSRNSGVSKLFNQCSSGIENATEEILDSKIDWERMQRRKFNDERLKNSLSSSETHEKFSTDELLALKSECTATHKTQNQKRPEVMVENIVSTDSENNQVLVKIVTTHKPTIARVENDHIPKAFKKRVEKSRPACVVDPNVKETGKVSQDVLRCEAKDTCDKDGVRTKETPKTDSVDDPAYANIFDATCKIEGPIYENVTIPRTTDNKMQPWVKDPPAVKKDNTELKTGSVKKEDVPKQAKSAGKLKSKKLSTLVSGTSSSVGKSVPRKITDSRETLKSREKSQTNDSSVGVSKDKSSGTKQMKKVTAKNETKPKNSKTVAEAVSDAKPGVKSTSTAKSKKPIEVVYQTAIFNMRNEKLSKPTKSKEIKGPRYINDLICGSRVKRPSKNSTTQPVNNKPLPLTNR